MAKGKSKISQTDYTTGGRDISNTAIPYYTENLGRLDNYLSQDYADILNKYVGLTNDSAMNDYLRDYQTAMSNMASNNYSATGGGYTSSGQQAVDNTQRYYNDLMSRLASNNLSNATALAQNEYNNINNALTSYNTAYGQGANYSNIQQYNDQVNNYNKNLLWNNILGLGGSLIGGGIGLAKGNPKLGYQIGSTAGGALGNIFSPIDSTTLDALLSRYTGVDVNSNENSGRYNPYTGQGIYDMYENANQKNQPARPTTVSENVSPFFQGLQSQLDELRNSSFNLSGRLHRF